MRFWKHMGKMDVLFAWILGFAFIFQEICFGKVICNSYIHGLDNQLASYNIEHWYLWIKGIDDFFTTGQFYPLTNNVGFLDMMILFAPFYIVARIFFGHSVSYLISAAVVHLLGAAGIYYLDRKVFRFSWQATVISMFLFSFSNNLKYKSCRAFHGRLGVGSRGSGYSTITS